MSSTPHLERASRKASTIYVYLDEHCNHFFHVSTELRIDRLWSYHAGLLVLNVALQYEHGYERMHSYHILSFILVSWGYMAESGTSASMSADTHTAAHLLFWKGCSCMAAFGTSTGTREDARTAPRLLLWTCFLLASRADTSAGTTACYRTTPRLPSRTVELNEKNCAPSSC